MEAMSPLSTCTNPTESAIRLLVPRLNLLPQIGAKALDALARLLQRRGRSRVGDAECRAEPERRPLHHRHALGVEKLGDEILVGLDAVAGRCRLAHGARAGRIDVERALRLRALDALGLVEHGDAQVAPFLEDLVVLR